MKTDFILAALFGALALAGCHGEYANPIVDAPVVRSGDMYEYTVDGCHYLTTSRGGIVHKANCTNHVSDLKSWQMQNAIVP